MGGRPGNAEGPNEFLHIPTARRVSPVIAQVLADHAARSDASNGFSAGVRRWDPEPRALGSRRADVITLQIADSLGAQQGRIRGVLYALGNRAQAKTLSET